jgi:hypothetical protein
MHSPRTWRNDRSPNRIIFDRAAAFTDWIQRSEKAFNLSYTSSSFTREYVLQTLAVGYGVLLDC